MSQSEERKVGERGQVTLPKELREKLGIHGGDEVLVHEEDGKITIEKPLSREELAEGYRRRAAESEALAEEMDGVSREADEYLGDVPKW
ncbi:AbrB/MazE/SpoVT family DNA-binding domain-containing protein [Halorubrum sp. SD626R]|uniref:AbrB/MazE/SpoVT family DNA-binding domain-containing protein n=1 Tax=Halorubrum TaxID=56688 RepID=UPI0010F5B123|nr:MULTISPECIES: AbrB/MazE/SpoVT family DNA-binding domain-containing protein [Halorubrum]TKX78894.1 AbrB/MazE/SpoVT family DNA-binding domain-containing protein [Halorubrum sp. SD626R]